MVTMQTNQMCVCNTPTLHGIWLFLLLQHLAPATGTAAVSLLLLPLLLLLMMMVMLQPVLVLQLFFLLHDILLG